MRKMIAFIIALSILSVSLIGCGEEEKTNNTVTVNENTVVDTNND